MPFYEQLSVGDRVMITREGADEYRKGIKVKGLAAGAVLGAPALMAAAPGAFLGGIGIAAAGMGIGVPAAGIKAAGAAAGAGVGRIVADFFYCPEASDVGVIVDKEHNTWQDGFKYKVKWDLKETDKGPYWTWHTSKYLCREFKNSA